ncbi:S8 family serine peptidase [Actinoplanes sp. NPDC023801]|uniref:S8 family serine peptidase n=1 Tax=Actinoplanes sp. NPDC023801 TaxID=3154595 RepID=UPI00340CBAB4
MRMPVRRNFLAVGIAAVTAAALGAFALPAGSQAFSPVSYSLALPATVSAAAPVRIVTTSLDASGRPVFAVQEATDKSHANRIAQTARARKNTVAVEVDVPVRALGASSEDEYSEQQWGLEKISMPAAWESSTGADVVVAVVDTGVDGVHPDLDGQVLGGYDAIEDIEGGDWDGNGHGTHVAGIVAAVAGNGEGIAGVAPGAKILPVRVLDADGSGYVSDTAEGIVWAADNGAQIINLSLGSDTATEAEEAAVAYAVENGVTVVAAAGNEREDGSPTSYPAAFDGVIAVAATDARDEVAEYSNRGEYVDVAAPGSGILSTYPAELSEDGGGYAELNGTSMASPHVAAVAALIKAVQPDITPDGIQKALQSSAVDLGDDGFDSDFGYGRIDAAAAIEAAGGGGDGGDGERITPELAADEGGLVGYGSKTSTEFQVTVDGEGIGGLPGEACVSVGGGWDCEEVEGDEDGYYVVDHVATGAFQVRLTVAENEVAESVSGSVGYTVRAQVSAKKSAKGTITVKAAGAAGQKMTLQRKAGSGWKTVKALPVKSSTKITGLAAGSYRVVVAAAKTVQGVTSGTVKL